MSISIFWTKQNPAVAGLDQLGIRVNGIRIFSHLVPGITVLTNRARYYSLHAYVVHWWAKFKKSGDAEGLRTIVRRAEAIAALAEGVVAHQDGRDSPGVVGSRTVARWTRGLPSRPPENLRAPLADVVERYSAYRWGGFGQYSSTSAAELGLLRSDGDHPVLLDPFGVRLAELFEHAAISCRLPEFLDGATPTYGDLRRIGERAGFSRLEGAERDLLRDILIDPEGRFQEAGQRRRNTFLLILLLAGQHAEGMRSPLRACTDASLRNLAPSGKRFDSPEELATCCRGWRVFFEHEFMTVALETFLTIAVRLIGENEFADGFSSAEEIADAAVKMLPASFRKDKVRNLVRTADREAGEVNEVEQRDSILDATRAGKEPDAIRLAIAMLARVFARIEHDNGPYSPLGDVERQIERRRFNLEALRRLFDDFQDSTVAILIHRLMRLAVNTHLEVASAKLAYTGIYSYKVVRQDGVYCKVEDLEPGLSQPRLNQAAQMLADLGYLDRRDGLLWISQDGRKLLGEHRCL